MFVLDFILVIDTFINYLQCFMFGAGLSGPIDNTNPPYGGPNIWVYKFNHEISVFMYLYVWMFRASGRMVSRA